MLVPFRSLHTLATRTLAAGAASALALTMFNAAQPSLGGPRKISPGTLKDVQLTLSSVPVPGVGSAGVTAGTGSVRAAPGAAAAQPAQSAPVAVGKARFVGFSWPEQAAVGTVWLRARTRTGWSGWREVEQAADGPDATSREYRPGRAYSDGQWLDAGTNEIQLRVDAPSAGSGSRAGAGSDAKGGAAAEGGAGAQAAPTGPTTSTAQPRIISRAGWGADERIRRAAPVYSDTVKAAFVHHTVQSNSYSPSESAALIRADYLYHVRSRGWNDIGYNFLVDRYGRVFEGRYGGITRAVLGAHAGGFNTDSTGVALLGTFTIARPTAPMLAGLERLLAWKLDLTHGD